MFVPFEDWTPDRASLTTGSLRALNVVPTPEGFESAPGFNLNGLYPTLPEEPLDVTTFEISDGSVITIAFCRTHVYKLGGSTVWIDITRQSGGVAVPYITPEDGFWCWLQWGDLLYFVNYVDNAQKFDLSIGAFAVDTSLNMTGGFRARFNIIVRDFALYFDTNDSTGSNANPFRMHWSGRLRPEDLAPSLATGAGWRDIVDIGQLRGAVGGEYGIVLGSNAAARIDAIGPPLQFQIQTFDEDVGCLYPESIIKVGGSIIWYSRIGWRRSEGGPSVAIGQGRVDNHFRTRLDTRSVVKMSRVILRDRPVIVFSYVSVDSVDGNPDEIIYYNYETNKWSEGYFRCITLGTVGPAPFLIDDPVLGELFIDDDGALTDTDDDAIGTVAAIGLDRKTYTVTLAPAQGLMTLREVELQKGRRSRVTRVRLIAEGNSEIYRARVSSRDKQPQANVQRDPWLRPERTGSCAADKRGRYHRVEIELNDLYKAILGVDVDYVDAGKF